MYTTSPTRPIVAIALDEWRAAGGAERAAIAALVDGAARDPGVFLLRPTSDMGPTIADAVAATRAFFALPLSAKRACEDAVDQFVGYRGLGANRNSYGGADVKEMFHIGPRHAPSLAAAGPVDVEAATGASPLWPAELPVFVDAWHRYYALMQAVADDLRDMFELALAIDEGELADLWHENSADLAANSYPLGDEHAGQVRNAAHADQTLFTVLHQDGRASGLSIEWADGTWEPVELDGSAFLVNIGQLFELITGGTWRAVPHQVEPAAPTSDDGSPRLTIPFFFRPRAAALLHPLAGFAATDPSPPTLAEWLASRRRPVSAPINPS